jgi:serine/threonine-protein kinase
VICPSCREKNDEQAAVCFACGQAFTASIRRGALVGARYEISERLGSGGMGTVYKARDRVLEETVALKVLRLEIARSPAMARRFRSEIRLARRVRHPNVCGIHEYGEEGELRYISMELIEGTDLKQIILQNGALPMEEAYDVSLQLAEGLQAIHDVGIIHRDLKTANVMRDSRGLVRLMDFGIAKEFGAQSTTNATLTGHILGTPEYMSPEQARSEPLDPRSDVYALGIVIFEIFSGHVPFHGDTPVATLLKHLQEPLPLQPGEARGIPQPLLPVLRKALAKNAAERYATAKELIVDLRRAQAASLAARPPGAAASAFQPTVAAVAVPEELPIAVGATPPPGPATLRTLSARPTLTRAPSARAPERVTEMAATVARAPASARAPGARRYAWLAVATLLLAAGAIVATLSFTRSAPPSPTPTMSQPIVTPMPPPPTEQATHSAGEVQGGPPATAAPEPSLATAPAVPVASAVRTDSRDRGTGASSRVSPPPVIAAAPASPTLAPRSTPGTTTAPAPSPSPAARASGVLQVVVRPWAEVTIDGVAVGTTPFRPLTLGAGVHTIAFSHPDYKTFQRKVTIQPNEAARLEVDLAWEAFRR